MFSLYMPSKSAVAALVAVGLWSSPSASSGLPTISLGLDDGTRDMIDALPDKMKTAFLDALS